MDSQMLSPQLEDLVTRIQEAFASGKAVFDSQQSNKDQINPLIQPSLTAKMPPRT
ncbi:hypothetical protein PtA15_3A702 [Puccinia triticina]|uniref:Uncharacterized protein n=1 Tax=Puccinia triticina TaxID=208348 RepID=A0ABY7CDP4_9BASI|nr:uncharacterized protein PtA15_3A702 [Puccinia triticina]WAQ83333.1 hypothetical protein PtA15_3A702 [Puccinia triticina]WAR54183.1 hypothetical protein PtB15_3B696 [Puccinia triticina]